MRGSDAEPPRQPFDFVDAIEAKRRTALSSCFGGVALRVADGTTKIGGASISRPHGLASGKPRANLFIQFDQGRHCQRRRKRKRNRAWFK
jgi:hypothetical protein